jgi:hypothetical protein
MDIYREILWLTDQISILNSRDKEMIKLDLDHHEPGIAFEHLVGTIYINKVVISSEVFNSIKKISKQMKFEKDTWKRLMPFVKK